VSFISIAAQIYGFFSSVVTELTKLFRTIRRTEDLGRQKGNIESLLLFITRFILLTWREPQ